MWYSRDSSEPVLIRPCPIIFDDGKLRQPSKVKAIQHSDHPDQRSDHPIRERIYPTELLAVHGWSMEREGEESHCNYQVRLPDQLRKWGSRQILFLLVFVYFPKSEK